MPDDVVDLAQAAMLAEQEALMAGIRRPVVPAGRRTCRECGEEIDPARRAVHPHAQHCTFCQGQIEERLPL